jgi:prevent-host-death family protein
MSAVAASRLRKELSETLNKVAFKGERVILERHGKGVAALISMEDYLLFERLEELIDTREAERILNNLKKEDVVSWDKAKKELD